MKCCGARHNAHFHWCREVGGPGYSGRQLQDVVSAERAARRARERAAVQAEQARQLAERAASRVGRSCTQDMIDRALALLVRCGHPARPTT